MKTIAGCMRSAQHNLSSLESVSSIYDDILLYTDFTDYHGEEGLFFEDFRESP